MKTDMRIVLTKQLLRKGMLSLIGKMPLSRISVTALCQASGVNRATFYNHYDSVPMILREIVWEYAEKIETLYMKDIKSSHSEEHALETCLTYLQENKEEIIVLFSNNTESYIKGFGLEVVEDVIRRHRNELRKQLNCSDDELYLFLMTTASGAYGLILTWLTRNMKQTPKEITAILRRLFSIRTIRP